MADPGLGVNLALADMLNWVFDERDDLVDLLANLIAPVAGMVTVRIIAETVIPLLGPGLVIGREHGTEFQIAGHGGPDTDPM